MKNVFSSTGNTICSLVYTTIFEMVTFLFGSYGQTFVLTPEQYAIRVRIDPVENSVVAALGNTHGQESNTKSFFFVIEN